MGRANGGTQTPDLLITNQAECLGNIHKTMINSGFFRNADLLFCSLFSCFNSRQ